MTFINWLQYHLLPCPFKWLTGIDCPGCGFQRSILELVQGNLYKSLQLYPPTIFLLIVIVFLVVNKFIKPESVSTYIKRSLLITAAVIIMLNYGYKITSGYYSSSVAAVK